MSDPVFGDEGDGAPLRAATRFGPYVLCYELASGGMGTVFLAKAVGPGGFERLVALKRVHPHLARDARFATMFLDEARIAARIQHPNVCGVYEFGEVDGTYYLTMPYLAGEPLHRVLQMCSRATRSLREERPWAIARLVVDACEGLHAAHELRDERGQHLDVVHRDVSPQNLLVGYDGSARVLDFGVASARHRLQHTSKGEVKGKLAYLAPEQLADAAPERGVDVWALGVVLWEGLTGRRLFARDNVAATVSAVSEGTVPPLSDFVELPNDFQRVVDRALARDRDARYATAREMGRDLLRALGRHRVVGPAEVSEWLTALFPDGRAAGERLVEESRVLALDEVSDVVGRGVSPEAPAERTPESVVDTLRRVSRAPADASEMLAQTLSSRRRDGGGVESAEPTPPRPQSQAPTRRARGSWVAVLLVGSIGLVLVGLTTRSSQAPSSTGVATPLASTSDVLSTAPVPAARSALEGSSADFASRPIGRSAASEGSQAGFTPRGGGSLEGLALVPIVVRPEPESEAAATVSLGPDEPMPDPPTQGAVAPTRYPTRSVDTSARPGRLRVATPGGWAVVFRGRARLGETPGTFTLPAGTHDIGIQPFGEGPILRRRVVIPPAGSERVTIPVH